jgi:hypothetical protein
MLLLLTVGRVAIGATNLGGGCGLCVWMATPTDKNKKHCVVHKLSHTKALIFYVTYPYSYDEQLWRYFIMYEFHLKGYSGENTNQNEACQILQ